MATFSRSACAAVLAFSLSAAGCSKPNPDPAPAPENKPKAPEPPAAKPKDIDLIQGTWNIESVEFDGKKEADKAVVGFKGNTMFIREREDDDERDPFTLDESKQPKTIDIEDANKKAAPRLGIYELNGDGLRICWAKGKDATRPTAFESKPGSNTILLTLKRDRSAPPIPDVKEPDFASFPSAIIGQWKFSNGETAFGFFAPDTEFTKDGRVLQQDFRTKLWEEKYKYRFEKDELVLVFPKPGGDGRTDLRFKIASITDVELVSKSPRGKLKRLK